MTRYICPDCHGDGQDSGETCRSCGGTGRDPGAEQDRCASTLGSPRGLRCLLDVNHDGPHRFTGHVDEHGRVARVAVVVDDARTMSMDDFRLARFVLRRRADGRFDVLKDRMGPYSEGDVVSRDAFTREVPVHEEMPE